MPTPTLLQRLKERKLVQWAVAYLAGAWVIYEAVDTIGDRWGLSDTFFQGLFVVLAIGFFITLVLAWYHGEKGRQRVSGAELLMVAALLVVAGGVLSTLPGGEEVTGPGEVTAFPPVDDDRPALAVLPFENYSTDSTFAFFANGMQEQILSTLSKISALRVISRSSVMQYAENRPNSRQIAEELGVSHLVEGSAQVAGGQVRLTVQVINAGTDEHLWSEDYDRELTAENLFEVRSEVGQQIAFHVGVNLTPNERDEVARVLTDEIDSYLLFIQGNEAFLDERQRGTLNSTYPSVRLYEQAIEHDPGFALARARLALSLTYTSRGSHERFRRAQREAEAALSALPGLSEARVALGRYFLLSGQAEEAKRHFQAAEEGSPNMALAVMELGLLQRISGEFDTGLRTLRRAEALDPRNPVILRALARSLIFDHRYDDALKANGIREAVDSSYSGILDRAWIHLLNGNSDGARLALSELMALHAWAFYRQIPGIPPTVSRRILPREENRAAFEAYRADRGGAEGPCSYVWDFCVRKAIHEQEAGSKELAQIHWDSLRVVVEGIPPGRWITYYKVLIYQGLGEKEAAIREAADLVSSVRTGPEVVEDVEYFGPASRILLARILAHFDEHDRAIDILEEELPAPSWLSVHILEIDPIWDPLRDHPRFQALLDEYRHDVGH